MQVFGKTEEDLMVDVRSGNLDALVPLFEKYHQRLYNFFIRMCGNRETAKDLVQNVFSRIINYRHTYNEAYKYKTWMYQMARNVHIDNYQKSKLEFTDDREVDEYGEKPDEALESFERDQQHKALHEAVRFLSEEDREIIELSRFQDLKYEEVAKITGNSEGAVRVKVHRAIKRLKEIYLQIA